MESKGTHKTLPKMKPMKRYEGKEYPYMLKVREHVRVTPETATVERRDLKGKVVPEKPYRVESMPKKKGSLADLYKD